jgi:predicted Rossmann fold nucleotide-binding protein DprA/Smf involved in DNA uptake
MSNGKELLEKLLVDKTEMRKNLNELVDKSLKIFRIEKETGKILFQNFGKLSDPERILTFLIGKYFATELELLKENELSISQISKEIGRPLTALSGPIRELVKKGWVEKLPTRRYRIVYHRMDEILDNLIKKNEKVR